MPPCNLGIWFCDNASLAFCAKLLLTGALWVVHTAVASLAFRCLTYLAIRVCDKGIDACCAKLFLIGTLWIGYAAVTGLAVRRLACDVGSVRDKDVFSCCAKLSLTSTSRVGHAAVTGCALFVVGALFLFGLDNEGGFALRTKAPLVSTLRSVSAAVASLTFRCLAYLGIRVRDQDFCLCAELFLTATSRIVHTAVAGLALCCLARFGIRVRDKAGFPLCANTVLTSASRVWHATLAGFAPCCLTYFALRVRDNGIDSVCANPGSIETSRMGQTTIPDSTFVRAASYLAGFWHERVRVFWAEMFMISAPRIGHAAVAGLAPAALTRMERRVRNEDVLAWCAKSILASAIWNRGVRRHVVVFMPPTDEVPFLAIRRSFAQRLIKLPIWCSPNH